MKILELLLKRLTGLRISLTSKQLVSCRNVQSAAHVAFNHLAEIEQGCIYGVAFGNN